MKAKWSVLTVHGNAEARKLAMNFCDSLVKRFWSEFSFEFNWRDWSELEVALSAKEMVHQAKEADMIIISMTQRGTIPPGVRSWIELALEARREREGFLAGLPVLGSAARPEAIAAQAYLRKLAHQSGMDYLTSVPQSLSQSVPESIESCNLRASQVTSVLDRILHHSSLPPRLL